MLRTRPVSEGSARDRIGGAIDDFFKLSHLKLLQSQKLEMKTNEEEEEDIYLERERVCLVGKKKKRFGI